jgi:hypothetical protein
MPDFEDRLERALTNQSTRTRRTRRRLTASTGVLATAAAITVGLAATGGHSDLSPGVARAQPFPKILYRPAAAKTPTDDELGVAGAQADRAREFAIAGHHGYVVPRDSGQWCISVPDLQTDEPDTERGTTCAPNPASLRRDGLAIKVGSVVAAALPAGAPAPTRTYRGVTRTVPVNADGIAAISDLRVGERFTVRPVDGAASSFTAEPKMKLGPDCFENGKPVINKPCSLVPDSP